MLPRSGLAAGLFGVVAEFLQFDEEAVAVVALDLDGLGFNGAAGAAAFFEFRGEGLEVGFGEGQAGDDRDAFAGAARHFPADAYTGRGAGGGSSGLNDLAGRMGGLDDSAAVGRSSFHAERLSRRTGRRRQSGARTIRVFAREAIAWRSGTGGSRSMR